MARPNFDRAKKDCWAYGNFSCMALDKCYCAIEPKCSFYRNRKEHIEHKVKCDLKVKSLGIENKYNGEE